MLADDEDIRFREIELKLEVAPGDVERIAQVAQQAGQSTGTASFTSTYFDTPKQTLRRAGLSLRIRQDGDRRIQTLKRDTGASVGLFDRSEWEFEVDGDIPDLSNHSELPALVGKKVLGKIAPVFHSVVERTTALAIVDGATIELVIDRGEVSSDGPGLPVCEIELELKSGNPASLFVLARRLDAAAPVRLGMLTKAERGYLLLAPREAGSVKAEPLVLHPETEPAAAFKAIAWSCLRHYRLNETILLAGGNASALHQARVALRRLRSAFTLFKPIVADDEFEPLRAELRWLSGVLGEARNIDVLIARARGADLLGRLQAERTRTYAAVNDALASPRTRGLMLDLAKWLTVGEYPTKASRHHPGTAQAYAADRLERLRKRLKADGSAFAALPDARRHDVRIEAKKLRYATEFFASLFPGKKNAKRFQHFRDALEAFQNILGDLNDEVTGREILQRLGLHDVPAAAWKVPDEHGNLVGQAVATYDLLASAKRFW